MPVSMERIVLFASEGGFSRPVLRRLLGLRKQVVAVVLPGDSSQSSNFPVAIEQYWPADSLAGLAVAHNLTVIRCQPHIDHAVIEQVIALNPDFLLVACFPYRLPATLWQSRHWHCWNLHPSILPKYRGPDPLFWQLRRHETDTGVTLHQLSGKLDAGDIIAQRAKALPAKVDATSLNEWVAGPGVELFLEALEQCRLSKLVTIPQDELSATYFPSRK